LRTTIGKYFLAAAPRHHVNNSFADANQRMRLAASGRSATCLAIATTVLAEIAPVLSAEIAPKGGFRK